MLIFTINVSVFAEEKPIADWTSSIVRIVQYDMAGNWLSHGTGFPIGNGEPVSYFITNNHVIDGGGQIVEISVLLGKDDLVDAKIVATLPIADIAIIKTKAPLYGLEPFVLSDVDDIKIGDFTYALGFPGASITDSYADSYSEDVTITKGIIGKKTVQASGVNVYQMDTAISPGNSGGPLLNEQGQVIAINSFGYINLKSADVNGAVLISYVTDLLTSRGIEFLSSNDITPSPVPSVQTATSTTQAPTSTPVSQTSAEPEVIPSAESVNELTSTPVPVKSTNNKILIIAIIAGIIILGIIVALIFIIKKKPILPTASLSGPGIITPFDISAKPCTIGRDQTMSDIVNTDKKISRQHVSVSYNNGVFTVIDLSSNGTFLADGTRLEKSKPYELKSGDSIYLYSKKNMYKLEQPK